ncbi:MAG: hypothetical protein V4560_08955 [Bacteroidota bacterium]
MIALSFNFAHPFKGRVLLRNLDSKTPVGCHRHFDSEGRNDFEIPLDIKEDGRYRVALDWGYEDRNFFHQSDILVRSGKLVSDQDLIPFLLNE